MPIVGYSRASSAFSPLSLSPTLWLDASNAGSITSSGGAVSQWSDLSGNNNHCTQSTAGAKPTTGATTQNGLNVIDFDGGSDFLDYATSLQPVAAGGLSVVAVARRAGSGGTLVTERATTQVRAFQYLLASEYYISSDGVNSSSNHQIEFATFAATASPFQTTFTSVSGSRMVCRLNGTARTVTTGTATTMTGGAGGRIGRREGAIQFWQGWMAEIIAVPAVLTAQQITDVETYLKNKWGTP